MRSHQYEDAVIIGSALMHYSFHKAADLLGLGVRAVVRIPTDAASRMRYVVNPPPHTHTHSRLGQSGPRTR
jgi:glutamate/tyrosine decarboxylase-like PLP-dependent enzyme